MNKVSKTIYHADDDTFYLEFVYNIFNPFHLVLPSYSGKHIIDQLNCMLADLIILDVDMPEMDGLKTIEHIKKNEKTKNIPVIFFSGNKSLEIMKKCLILGATDFITKPCSPEELKEKVDSLLYT